MCVLGGGGGGGGREGSVNVAIQHLHISSPTSIFRSRFLRVPVDSEGTVTRYNDKGWNEKAMGFEITLSPDHHARGASTLYRLSFSYPFQFLHRHCTLFRKCANCFVLPRRPERELTPVHPIHSTL